MAEVAAVRKRGGPDLRLREMAANGAEMAAVRNFLIQEWDAAMGPIFMKLTRGTIPRPPGGKG